LRIAHAATAGPCTFHVHGQTFEDPAWLNLVWGKRLADNGINQRRYAADMIRVKNMRVFVGNELDKPVIHIPKRRHVFGCGGDEPNRIVGQRACGPVRTFAEVRKKDFRRLARRPPDCASHFVVDAFAHIGNVLRNAGDAVVVGDPKVRGFDRVPAQRRVARRCRDPRSHEPREADKSYCNALKAAKPTPAKVP
jgi:hypothetical protein